MSIEKISNEIWQKILKHGSKLSLEERANLAIEIDEVLNSNQQSTVDFDRLMALESEVLRQEKLIKGLTDQLYFEASRINEQDDRLDTLSQRVAISRMVKLQS
jgi:uncharacterized coiled-coil protein SlyX